MMCLHAVAYTIMDINSGEAKNLYRRTSQKKNLVKFDPHEIGMKEVKERMEATNRLKVGTIVQTHTSDRSASRVILRV